MNLDDKLMVRPKTDNDMSFIYSSWLRSNRGSVMSTKIPNNTYYHEHKKVINFLLKEREISIDILCSKDDPDHILGFISYENGIIHFLYIKYSYRKMGFANFLLEKVSNNSDIAFKTITHYNNYLRDKLALFDFNPYLLSNLGEQYND